MSIKIRGFIKTDLTCIGATHVEWIFVRRERPIGEPLGRVRWPSGVGIDNSQREGKVIMKFSNTDGRRAGVGVGCLLGGVAAAMVSMPTAAAAPDQCGADQLAGTVSSVTGQARQYLGTHPGANQVVTAAYGQPRDQASSNIRGYFTANPQEYYELRGILAPIGDAQRQCNVTLLPADLAAAYTEFMAG
jgi:heme-binding protein